MPGDTHAGATDVRDVMSCGLHGFAAGSPILAVYFRLGGALVVLAPIPDQSPPPRPTHPLMHARSPATERANKHARLRSSELTSMRSPGIERANKHALLRLSALTSTRACDRAS